MALDRFGRTLADRKREQQSRHADVLRRSSHPMRMNVDGGGTATEGPATFVLQAISDLRASGSGTSGRFRPMAQTGPAPCRGHANAAGEPAEDPADMRALREDVENLRGEVRRLTRLVVLTRTRNEREPRKPVTAELRRATMAHERATARFDDAASHLVRTVSGAEARRDWERTDEAVAGLIVALSKQIPLRRELAGARGAAANRVRHIRALERAEKERRAIRRLLARRWWKFGLG